MTATEAPQPVASGELDKYPLPALMFYLYKKRFNGCLSVAAEARRHRTWMPANPVRSLCAVRARCLA